VTQKPTNKLQYSMPKLSPRPKAEVESSLVALESWTEEPARDAASRLSSTPTSAVAPSPAPISKPIEAQSPQVIGLGAPVKPWKVPPSTHIHRFNFIGSEELFQKLDYVWKRNGWKSMSELINASLDQACNDHLRSMGEEP
jgi:hypothetical protein